MSEAGNAVLQRLRAMNARFGAGGRPGVFRNMLTLAAGSSSAKALAFLTLPVVTRLYSPEEFGAFSLFLALTMLLGQMATFRYSAALPLPKRDGLAVALLIACCIILAGFATVLAVTFGVFGSSILGYLGMTGLESMWPLIVVSAVLVGAYEILTSWSVRKKRFGSMAVAEFGQSGAGNGLKIALALASSVRGGLVVGHLAGQIVACAVLLRSTLADVAQIAARIRFKAVREAWFHYRDFPAFRLPSQVLLMFSVQSPLFFMGLVHGAASAGQLGLALSVLAVPITLVGQTTGQAYYAEIARIGRNDPTAVLAVSKDVAIKMLIVGLVPTLVLIFSGQWLFAQFFGANWAEAGLFASLLAIYLLTQFVANPLAHALSVFRRQKLLLQFNIVRALLVVGVFAVAYATGLDARLAILAYSVVLALHYALTTLLVFRVIKDFAGGGS